MSNSKNYLERQTLVKQALSFRPRGLGKRVSNWAASATKNPGQKAYNFGKLLVTGNELEGLLAGAQLFTGYAPGLLSSLGLGIGFDLARPHVKKLIQGADNKLLSRWGNTGIYGDVRKNLGKGYGTFRTASKLAPLAQVAGGVQQMMVGFNQFDPAMSIEIGKERTMQQLANSLGYEDIGSLKYDVDQLRPAIGGISAVTGGVGNIVNRLRSPAIQQRLSQLSDDEIEQLAGQAIGTYGSAFLDRNKYDQAAMIDFFNRQARGL